MVEDGFGTGPQGVVTQDWLQVVGWSEFAAEFELGVLGHSGEGIVEVVVVSGQDAAVVCRCLLGEGEAKWCVLERGVRLGGQLVD